MDKLKMHSHDITQQNIDKLLELFPNCKTEKQNDDGELRAAIDFDLLKQELSKNIVDGPQERYQLNWPGKKEALLTANAPIAKTLRPCREESVDFDITENIFIEGDNLDALKLLQETYLGKVSLIYIDPPYNTKNDFIYNDDFAEETEKYLLRSNQNDNEGNRLTANPESNGRRHSDWLSMMYSRIKLARNLLSDDGVIFISIDDNEVANLRKICNEIFGEVNQINPIVHNKLNAKNDTANVQRNHEYALIYRKETKFLSNTKVMPSLINRAIKEKEVFKDESRYFILKDPITTRGDGGTLDKRCNLGYSIYYNPKTKDFLAVKDYDTELASTSNDEDKVYTVDAGLHHQGYIPIRPPRVRGRLGAWTWELEKFNSDKDLILIKETKKGYSVHKREFVDSKNIIERNGKHFVRYLSESNSKSVLEYSTNEGSSQLSKLFGVDDIFSNPKNVEYIKYIIGLIPRKEFLFLDFFAGSASSIQALIEKNLEDKGRRRFIAVQIPEVCGDDTRAFQLGYSTISEISKERIRLAGIKIKEENPDLSILDTGFRVLKIDSSNMNDVHYTPDAVVKSDLFNQVEHIKTDRSSEDLLFQVMLDWGVDLSLPIRKEIIEAKEVYLVNDDDLVACFDKGIDESLIKALAAKEPLRVVFRDDCFVSDSVKINVEQIFKQLAPSTDIKAI